MKDHVLEGLLVIIAAGLALGFWSVRLAMRRTAPRWVRWVPQVLILVFAATATGGYLGMRSAMVAGTEGPSEVARRTGTTAGIREAALAVNAGLVATAVVVLALVYVWLRTRRDDEGPAAR